MDPGALRGLLEGVNVVTGEGTERLFTVDELNHINVPIAEALAQARPEEDVILFSTFKRNGGLLSGGLTVTARLFVTDGRLQFIVREARIDYAGPVLADVAPPMPEYGARAVPGAAVLRARVGEPIRADWLAFPLASIEAPVPVAPAAAPAPAPARERLLRLKQLREQNLITEDEYQKKRGEILKDL